MTRRRGKETILLADDEDGVRKLAAAVLEDNGHRVIQARDGAEAIEAFRKSRKQVRLILLDLKMPRMSGWEALKHIQRLDPEVPVILTSGCALDEERVDAHQLGARALLPKPYRAQTLLTAVGESLDAQTSARTAVAKLESREHARPGARGRLRRDPATR